MKKLLFILWLGALVYAQPKPTIVFANVSVVDTREGGIAPGMNVVIKDGRIADVSKTAIKVGRNVQVIDGAGKYLIPGLWDMHVHSAFVSPAWDERSIYTLYVANGITGVRDMGGDFELLKQRRQRIDAGELLGPHLVIAGPFVIDGKADAQTFPVHTPEEARAAVDKLQKDGADFIKILSRLSRESYFALAEQARKDKIYFVGHVPGPITALEASNAGQHSIEHLSGITLACSSQETELTTQINAALAKRDWAAAVAAGKLAGDTYDGRKASELFMAFVKNNTWQVPTLIWTRTQSRIDAADFGSDPRLKYVPAAIRPLWDPKKMKAETLPVLIDDYKNDAARGPGLVKAMQQAGVQLLAGSDGPDPWVVPGFSLPDELELLVGSGLTTAEALQAATYNPALFLEKLDTYGVVEKGYAADLVLLDADPLENIGNVRRISGVMLGGKYFTRGELDRMLGQVEQLAK